jgi:hypothetical protein
LKQRSYNIKKIGKEKNHSRLLKKL